MSETRRRVAVIGGGISGLSAAHRLREIAPQLDVTLFEAADRLGGILETRRQGEFLIERAADMFTTREPWAYDLCRRIGFTDQLIDTNPKCRRAFVVSRGALVAVPEGFTLLGPARIGPILRTPLLSWVGKLRLAAEYFVPPRRTGDDESLRDFAVRRFGREAYERLIQPLIGGIYTADPTRLSMNATMAQFVQMEREHGSLIRGMRRTARQGKKRVGAAEANGQGAPGDRAARDVDPQASGARYGLFVAPRDGMSSFIAALAARLSATVRLGRTVSALRRTPAGGWQVVTDVGAEEFDGLIMALPAPQAGPLVRGFDMNLGDRVAAIEYAGAAVVVACYRRDQFRHPLDGFGFVAPIVEGRRILSASFANIKFAGRAPDDQVIVRTFIGGACQPELLRHDDRMLCQIAAEELGQLLGLTGAPSFETVVRWEGRMPQYHVGHVGRVEAIEELAAKHSAFALAGNAYRGVGIPFCVRSGEAAAATIARQLGVAVSS